VPLARILSGGQSGVDRAALDAAGEIGVEHGGWCPKGRWAEDGPIPPRYTLRETPSANPAQRTEWNVRDSDATLALLLGRPALGGTALTIELARQAEKPLCVADLAKRTSREEALAWLVDLARRHPALTLNVAGPRESQAPGVCAAARAFLAWLLGRLDERGLLLRQDRQRG